MKEVIKYLEGFNWNLEEADRHPNCPYSYQSLRKAKSAEGRVREFLLEEETGKNWVVLQMEATLAAIGGKYEVVETLSYRTTDLDRFGTEDVAERDTVVVPVGRPVENEKSRVALQDYWNKERAVMVYNLFVSDEEVLKHFGV